MDDKMMVVHDYDMLFAIVPVDSTYEEICEALKENKSFHGQYTTFPLPMFVRQFGKLTEAK